MREFAETSKVIEGMDLEMIKSILNEMRRKSGEVNREELPPIILKEKNLIRERIEMIT